MARFDLVITMACCWLVVMAGMSRSDLCPGRCECEAQMDGDYKVTCYALTQIPDSLPQNTISLKLNYNEIRELNRTIFSNLTKLQDLFLRGNNLVDIPVDTFDDLLSLQKLILGFNPFPDRNQFMSLLDHVTRLPGLRSLDISDCNLQHDEVPQLLTVLSQSKLVALSIGHNDEAMPFPNASFANMTELLFLKFEGMPSGLDSAVFAGASSLRNLSLIYCRLTTFPVFLDPLTNRSMLPTLRHLDLTENLIDSIPDVDVGLGQLLSLSLRWNPFYAGQVLLDFDSVMPVLTALDLSSNPSSIFYTKASNLIFYNVGKFKIGPFLIDFKIFWGLPKLRTLITFRSDYSQLTTEGNDELFLRKQHDLENLDLGECRISTLTRALFQSLSRLKNLNLKDNLITVISPGTFATCDNLEALNMHSNRLGRINQMLLPLRSLKELDLSNNPFICDCDLLWLFELYHRSSHRINVFPEGDYKCNDPHDLRGLSFDHINITATSCAYLPLTRGFILSVSICGGVQFAIVMWFLVSRYCWNLRYLSHVARFYQRRYREVDADMEYPYDAFLVYHNQQIHWIRSQLLPKLEEESGLKLCLHDRDWLPGIDIVDNIVGSIENSRKTVLIVSNAFATSEWCQFELAMAQTRHLKLDRNALILVVMEEIRAKNVTPRLGQLMRTKTYVEWTDHEVGKKLFWKKLRRALQRCNYSLIHSPV